MTAPAHKPVYSYCPTCRKVQPVHPGGSGVRCSVCQTKLGPSQRKPS